MTKIYVSSTYSDLVEHRQQVYDVLRKMRYDVIAMEDYVATDQRPLDKCLADVASCDIYVGIFAWRYGYVPPGQERSITELEYRQAGERGLERLIFLLHEDAPWLRSKMESGEGGEKIEALRGELMAAHTMQFFKSPEELAGQVATSVAQWAQAQLDADMDSLRARRDQADRERRERRERQRVVNLRPLDVAHFKNRLREIQALCDHLADAGVRLVSVVGRGGMGKTALACRVLADLEEAEETGFFGKNPVSGILYLSARSTGLGLERIYADVGRMLGEPAASQLAARWADRDTSLAAKVEYLLETLRDGPYLVLLDNLEDALTEEGDIAEEGLCLFIERCLTQPDGIRLIATSREEVRLAAAALPGARCIPLREGLPEDEAIALLRDLDPQGTLGLRDAPEDMLRRAARLTRGIPRALEILAGILNQDPTASLSRLLADEAAFGAEVVKRLVAAGYRRLGDDERRIMEALAVFDRPVDETAIAYLLHPWFPGLDVRAGLRRLVSGYFVSASRVTGEYSLHPLDQEYVYRHIPDEIETEIERGEEREGRRGGYTRRNLELRAAEFYANIRKPESGWKTIDDLSPQLAEFEHHIRAGDYDGACRVLEPVDSDYLFLWGHYTRQVGLREKLLDRLTDRSLQAHNLGSLGRTYHYMGQVDRAIKFYEKALAIASEISDRAEEGRHLGNLGRAYHDLGQFERGFEFYKEALTIAREIGDRAEEGRHLNNMGLAYHALGQAERAIKFYEEALAIAREIGDRREAGTSLNHLGIAYHYLGQVERAIKFLEEALAIAREIGDRRGEGYRLGNLGNIYRALGQVERAIKFYEEALVTAREIGDRRNESFCLGNLGIVCRDLGQVERALGYYEEALAIVREIGNRGAESFLLGNLGLTYRIFLGQVEQAIKFYEQALAITRETDDRQGQMYRLLGLGKALLASGKLSEARQCCVEALALDVRGSNDRAALALGIVFLYQRDPAAEETFTDAATHCRSMLDKTAGLYQARYTLATALVGIAVCDPRWAEERERASLLTPAMAEYQRAVENCAAPGVVRVPLYDLKLIRAAGVEGLEPAFELLGGAV